MRHFKLEVKVLLIYLLFFLLLFLQYPLSNSLIGNTDAIGTLSVYREHLFNLKEYFLHVPYGNVFYPERGLTYFCEEYWGETFLYGFISLAGFSDMVNVYLLIALMFALNAFSIFCLTYHYTKSGYSSFISGIAFSACSYMLCNSEMMNALAFFPVPFVLLYLQKFLDQGKPGFVIIASVALAMQFYFATYNFVYGFFAAAAFILFSPLKTKRVVVQHFKFVIIAVIAGLLLAAPGFYAVITNGNIENLYNPLFEMPEVNKRFSLELVNFTTSWPNNLLYNNSDFSGNQALKNQYYTNLGFAFWGVALLGLLKGSRKGILFGALVLIATLLSFGSTLELGTMSVTMPLQWLYKIDAVRYFYRIPGRTFVLAVFSLSVLLSFGLVYIQQRVRYPSLILSSILLLIVVENVPFPFSKDNGNALALIPNKEYLSFYNKHQGKIIAELPSSLFTNRFQYVNGVSEYSREYRYMYWQTLHKNYIINGSASFFPESRMYNNRLTKDIQWGNNLERLIAYSKLDYITLHKNLVLAEEEKAIEPFLKSSALLEKAMETNEVVIFRVKKYELQ